MVADIYGIIPSAKIEALANAPPVNRLMISMMFPDGCCRLASLVGSIPGSTTCVPSRYTSNIPSVYRILDLSSSIFQIFLNVSKNFFIKFRFFRRYRLVLQSLQLLILKKHVLSPSALLSIHPRPVSLPVYSSVRGRH